MHGGNGFRKGDMQWSFATATTTASVDFAVDFAVAVAVADGRGAKYAWSGATLSAGGVFFSSEGDAAAAAVFGADCFDTATPTTVAICPGVIAVLLVVGTRY